MAFTQREPLSTLHRCFRLEGHHQLCVIAGHDDFLALRQFDGGSDIGSAGEHLRLVVGHKRRVSPSFLLSEYVDLDK